MVVLILDPNLAKQLRGEFEVAERARWDEIWEGMYVVPPMPDIEHQRLAMQICSFLFPVIDRPANHLFAGVNVSDRESDWLENVRCPHVAVYLAGNPAKDCGTHGKGGPDFLAEIVMPADRVRDKLAFNASVGTREL